MAETINVAGLAAIKVDTGSVNALELLGYTRNGAEASFQAFMHDVHTDLDGGDDGPPSDMQELGQIATIRLELTKYDAAVLAKVECRQYGGTAGTVATPGALMFGGSKSYRLLIHSPTAPLNFPRVVFREPIEINKGTKFSTLILIGTAYKNASAVLYNTTTS